jgi:hypothetical protein
MQIANFDGLVEVLQKENVPFRADRDNQIVEIAVHTGPLHTEMVIRWEARLLLAQFIVAFPFHVPAPRIAVVEHALAIINHRLIMPGFGLDNDKRLLYFRLVTPRQDDGAMSYDHIHRLISAAVDTLLDFYPLLVAVVNEGKEPDALLDALAPSLSKLPESPEDAAAAVPPAAPATDAAAPAAQSSEPATQSAGPAVQSVVAAAADNSDDSPPAAEKSSS